VIFPYKNPRPHRTLAYLVDGDTVLHEDGKLVALRDALAGDVQVWADAQQLRELTRAGRGSAVLWRFVAIGWHPDRDAQAWPVRGLQVEQPESPSDTIRGLARWRDWLESYGAAPAGSLGGSGMSLLKATLERPLWTSSGDLPPIRYTLGGRQLSSSPTPRVIRGRLRHSDMVAAYANTLGRVRYGNRWQQLGPRDLNWRLLAERNPDMLVYVHAVVDIPDTLQFGPLPDRPRSQPKGAATLFWALEQESYPTGRRLQGTWSWPELQQAIDAGCKLGRVLDVWVHMAGESERPFARWLEAVQRGRDLGGFAGTLAKATGNATWGQLAIAKGQRKIVAKGRSENVRLRGGNPSQRAFDLAEWIAGSVRARLHAGIEHAGDRLVCAHTDGLWADRVSVPGWRVKRSRDADTLRLMDAQHLSYRRDGFDWEYVVAGVLDPGEWFEARWKRFAERGQVAA
jgi:hypothetical protein